jgi:histidinol-phosphatase (PHP family)
MAAECSSAGLRKPVDEIYPAPPLIERFVAAGVPFTTASDAHEVGHVAFHAAALRSLLFEAGIDSLQAYKARTPHQVPLAPLGEPKDELSKDRPPKDRPPKDRGVAP